MYFSSAINVLSKFVLSASRQANRFNLLDKTINLALYMQQCVKSEKKNQSAKSFLGEAKDFRTVQITSCESKTVEISVSI